MVTVKLLKLYVVRDRLRKNKAVEESKEVINFSGKKLAKTLRDELNKLEHAEDLRLGRKNKSLQERYYISAGPDHKRYRGGRI